jgi:hemerythrin
MEWTEDLSVGIREIDSQHQKLIGLINTLHDAMKSGQGKQALESTLQELAGYAVYHFRTEEEYMQKFHYPEYVTHKNVHDAFVRKVSDFQKEFSANRLGLTLDVMNFLRDWVSTHIKGTDKRYTATFQKGGVR